MLAASYRTGAKLSTFLSIYASDTVFAGYPANPKVGYRILGLKTIF
jgi:hypothetical protein